MNYNEMPTSELAPSSPEESKSQISPPQESLTPSPDRFPFMDLRPAYPTGAPMPPQMQTGIMVPDPQTVGMKTEKDSNIQKILTEHSRLLLDKNIQQIRILKKLLNCESISYELKNLLETDTTLIKNQIAALEKEISNHKLLPKMKSLLNEFHEMKNTVGREGNMINQIDFKLEEIKNPKKIYDTHCMNCGSNEKYQLKLKCHKEHNICCECICYKRLNAAKHSFPLRQMQIKCPISDCGYILQTQEINMAKENIQDEALEKELNYHNHLEFMPNKCCICNSNVPLYKIHDHPKENHNLHQACGLCLRNYLLYSNNGEPLLVDPQNYNQGANFEVYVKPTLCPWRDCQINISPNVYIELYGYQIDSIVDQLVTTYGLPSLQRRIFKIGPSKAELDEIAGILNRTPIMDELDLRAMGSVSGSNIEERKSAVTPIKKQDIEAVCHFEDCKETTDLTKRFVGCKDDCACFVCKKHSKEFGRKLLRNQHKCPLCTQKLDGSIAMKLMSVNAALFQEGKRNLYF